MTDLLIYDTKSRTKRTFSPIRPKEVGMYVCGMTVYDLCHMGHARVVIGFDVIYRWLMHLGYKVKYVRNITDIDDKIINRARENNEPICTLTARYIERMQEDFARLGCLSPSLEPRATDHIDDMQALIQTLLDKKLAYVGKDVYFAVNTFANYGALSGRKLDQMQEGARVAVDEDKKDPLDFVLWKRAKEDEVSWASPWGAGRPGWHIECSAMSCAHLGASFDIHGGGFDLQFPHHENEIAQSEGAHECTYANYWMHVGFVNVDGEKMSKSLDNFFTIADILDKFHPQTIRFFVLSSHYRSPINFSDEALTQKEAQLKKWYNALVHTSPKRPQNLWDSVYGRAFARAMNDDFNTAAAILVLNEVAGKLGRALHNKAQDDADVLAGVMVGLGAVLNLLQDNANTFLDATSKSILSEEDILRAIDARADAKSVRDFAKADAIRDALSAQGVRLLDTKEGTTWQWV